MCFFVDKKKKRYYIFYKMWIFAYIVAMEGGIRIQNFNRLDIISFLDLCLNPPNALIMVDKKVTLGTTLTLMVVWRLRNDKIFKNEEPNFHKSTLFLRTNFLEYYKLIIQ